MADETPTQYDPSAYGVDDVNAYVATADDAEKERVLAAEKAGKNRVSIVGKVSEEPKAEGIAALGNPADMAHPTKVAAPGIAHQDGGSNQAQRDAADKAAEDGFLGTPAPEKADYSQANPDVMNGGE